MSTSARLIEFIQYLICVVIYTSALDSLDSQSFRCGPKKVCTCVWYFRAVENITMDCSGQGLTSLGEICETVGNATHLNVSSNRINGSLCDDGRLDGCQKLVSLSLRNNTITDFEKDSMKRFKTLKVIDLSHNQLEIYRPNVGNLFESLSDLESLALNGNRVNNSDKFQWYPDLSNNTKLSKVYIDGLLETDHSSGVFPGLGNLKNLVISGSDGICEIKYIWKTFFQNITNLESLSLSMCDLEMIELHAFTALKKLQWLDLSINRKLGFQGIYNISYSLQFTNIKFLNYSYMHDVFGLGTEVTKQHICFLRNTSLQELALDGNRIQLMENDSIQLLPPTLQVVHVNDNIFTFGPYLLQTGCASNLTELYSSYQNIAHNPLLYRSRGNKNNKTIPDSPKCPFMEEDYLKNVSSMADNCIFFGQKENITIFPTFPKSLKKLVFNDSSMKYKLIDVLVVPIHNNVEHIDVSGNVLYAWNGPIGPTPKLKHVDLSRNYCSKVERRFFEYMLWLENLQIHSNLLGLSLINETYKDVFYDLINLKTLNISMNKITSLHPKFFKGLQNLETLDLSFNTMDKWDLEVNTMTNLSRINLRSNAFQTLPSHLTNHLERTAQRRGTSFSIDLRSNTFRYGCQTRKFLTWMVNHKTSFIGFEEYVFVDDDGVQIFSHDIEKKVNDLDKMCRSYTLWIVISVIGVSVALSVIIGGLLYRNRWKLRYFMYMSKQRFYGYVRVPNEEPLENYKYDAFISYAAENIRFVKDQIIPKTEMDDISLCIHQRDFLPGNAIADNIIDAIKSSRKTVILLTEAFLKRKWCMYEFNMARMENIYSRDGRSCLVIVMLENVATKHMPMEMLDWIQKESYLEYSSDENGEQLFWNSLVDAINQ